MSLGFYLCEQLQEVHELARIPRLGLDRSGCTTPAVEKRTMRLGIYQLWVYCPERKKGVASKLTSQCVGPCTVGARQCDVVYRVQLVGQIRAVVFHRIWLVPYQPLAHPDRD